MHASVRRYRTRDLDALESKLEDEFLDEVKEVEGLVAYYVIDGGDGDVAAVTLCETANALQQVTQLAGDWVRERVADLVDGEPEVLAGEVRLRAEP